jgi:hypothetical protein
LNDFEKVVRRRMEHLPFPGEVYSRSLVFLRRIVAKLYVTSPSHRYLSYVNPRRMSTIRKLVDFMRRYKEVTPLVESTAFLGLISLL